jgi:hypothetical protein
MKKYFLGFLLMIALFALASPASANEGIIRLSGRTDVDGRCFAASVYIDGSYKILMTCRGLKMALDPVKNKYVVWANVGERIQRLGEIVSGKLSASVPDKFGSLFVTIEPDGYPSKPSDDTVMTGAIEAIDFGKGVLDTSLQPTRPTAAQSGGQAAPAVINERGAIVPTISQANQGKLTGVVVGIGKAILLGFVLLLIAVGVMSFLARRKNL